MTTCAIYGRVSTAQKYGEHHLPELRTHAERNGWQVVEYLEGASAKQGGRHPVLTQLLKDAKAGKFQVLLCWKMNCLGRSVKDLIHDVEILHKAGVRFICLSQRIIDTDPHDPSGRMLRELLSVFAECERDLLAERIQLGVARALHQQETAARGGMKRRSRSGKNLSHGAPRKIWHRGRVAELHAHGVSIRQIAVELDSTYGSVRRALKENCEADDYAARGVAKHGKGDLDGAIADFTAAIQLNPDHAQAYRGRGLAKRAKNKMEGARKDLARAVELEAAAK